MTLYFSHQPCTFTSNGLDTYLILGIDIVICIEIPSTTLGLENESISLLSMGTTFSHPKNF
jgi:hypothetical protein